MTSDITTLLGDDGILVATMDSAGRPMNILNEAMAGPLAEIVDRLEADPAIKGLILTSAKKDFLAGADVDRLWAIGSAQEAFDESMQLKAFIRRLELCGKPVVAAIHGMCLGGGLEIAMGCHWRIVVDDGKAQLGLPEVKLGLLPGGGGTVRMPRLVGMQQALQWMAEGTEVRAAQALASGLVNQLAASKDEALQQARAWCLANPRPKQPWDLPKFRYPGGDSRTPAAAQLFAVAPSMASAKSFGNYPAVTHIMSSVFEGGVVGFDAALAIESRYFAACAISPESRNLIGTLWYQLAAIKKGQSRPAGFATTKVGKLGILGAGMMGAGIAYAAAKAGIEVVLLDSTQAAALRGLAYSQGLLDKAVKKGRSTPEKREALLALITPTTDYAKLAGCDLLIEAVFEDRAVKAEVTQQAEAVISADAVFASNTSTLPISGLARASSRPANFIGLHFFSPVDKMPLVEIIVGAQTSDETLARSFDFVLQIGKTPIVVNDSRGFYTSRVFATYVMEGLAMLKEGVHPRAIEQAGLQAGMPMPPLALQDEVSLSLGLHVADQTRKDLAAEGQSYVEHPGESVLRQMCALGRIGKKAGLGFYDYREGDKTLWPGLAEHYPLAASQAEQAELMDRLMFAQANEAARCLEEGVLRSVADANIGSIFGWGFAPFQGGALQFINAMGLPRFIQRSEQLAAAFGDRFKPAEIVRVKAAQATNFSD
ncbi:3-hydroxyacyl-CoA dehydrogenase NAD-binding domain-containing protein [Roseateles oligotrophus]|uniref:3-hydroxyacyl-CoA dehydrogenase NAD-binding domain-containing protein n=1 Tax=Roseateles oligotrophus TaxID=1769250 RepID=A0ABT2YHW1_9BURK|nr:3-hydroxyacyl-CoA dehydrogenase NAD-binding domain-containing protein [Roseateles oligotrophus]MCV2369648.1 3-hydroxyacyl-CoA dehydrogenase NAD-binding domain-containing protein [Roseateles oligotrophus]